MPGGGMGGGLMGMLTRGAMGGGRGMATGSAQTAENTADDYDVERWKRADGLDEQMPTLVQAVRSDWESRRQIQEKKGPLKKLFKKFSRKSGKQAVPAQGPEPRPAGGTVVTPEMKKASQRIHPAAAETPAPAARLEAEFGGKNYLGLEFHTEIGGFFTANPVNSAILAVDSLGMGALTLNQVAPPPGEKPHSHMCAVPTPGGGEGETAPEEGPASYMGQFRQNREQKKYNVRICP